MKKKMLSLIVSILMVLALIPQGAVAVMAQDEFSIDQIKDDEEKMITEMEAADQEPDENKAIPEDVPEVPEDTQQPEDAAESDAVLLAGEAGTEGYTTVTKDTHSMKSGTYKVTENVTIGPDGTGNGIQVDKGAKVLLYIEDGKTLTVTGRDADANGIGRAAILLPDSATLTVTGNGTLIAMGGKAGNGMNGGNAEASVANSSDRHTGKGGAGGAGGGGAGAGIGTDGGTGGAGGAGGEGVPAAKDNAYNIYGNPGSSGEAGKTADRPGTLFVTGSATVNATGGSGGSGGSGGKRGTYEEFGTVFNEMACSTSAGGAGGGGGSAADGIGCGGTGGGGGGGGASGNIDGEPNFSIFSLADLDDLYGYGGYGGSSTWGGSGGDRGDYGASNGGDDTGASKEYARAGGAGGSSAAPGTVAFYTYKDSSSDNPTVNCTAGHGVPRSATSLGSLQEFTNKGGSLVSSKMVVYDGKPHGVSVYGMVAYSSPLLLAQEEGGEADKPDEEDTITVDGVEVSYQIRYYDESGNRVGDIPVIPGQYVAVITFTSEDPEYCGDWVEAFAINKIEVEKPAPNALVFECADWETGEGKEQDAFLGQIDETDYEFVSGAAAEDGTISQRSASAAGIYQACFRLKNPETHVWAGEAEDAEEIWVPWSIALQEFDPGNPEITYWGTAYDNNTTTVTYTGEPVWVRPWFTYAKDTDGRYPEWFTHWGIENRPTTDRRSSAVFYIKGEDDREGLIGYHISDTGDLEPVTAEQVYAWLYGLNIDGTHVAVENGDKVWYKTDEDGWKVPIAVGGNKPEGAEGYVVARNYAYADKLGVKDPGEYRAYALFDDGAGFAPISLAETTVEVKKVVSYPLWVGGVQVTSANAANITDGETVTASYDDETRTLTLDGYSYSGEGYSYYDEVISLYLNSAIQYDGQNPLTILLKGKNSLTCTGEYSTDKVYYGIRSRSKGGVTIDGTGSLAVNAQNTGFFIGEHSVGGDLDIEGGSVTVNVEDGSPVEVNGNMVIGEKAGKVTVTSGGKHNTSVGVYGEKGLIINGGTVQITAYGENSKTIYIKSNSSVTIGENVTGFTAIGANGAFPAKVNVKNDIAGTGWTDVDGTQGMADIAVNTEGQKLDNYKKVQFPAIKRKSISSAKVTGITDKTYTGRELTQSKIKVVLNGKTLVEGTDYKVTYTDNTNAGTAKVRITGINGYKGTINKTFTITKATQTVKAVTPKSGATKEVALGKSFTIKATASKEQGTAQFKKVSGNSKLTLSSSGKVTAKKGLKKGTTYTLKYKVRIKETKNCKTTKYVTRTVKVKIK